MTPSTFPGRRTAWLLFALALGVALATGAVPIYLIRPFEVQTPRGAVVVPQLIVYWFVGGDTVESTYWRRLARDAWNRVLHARADRWAYVLMQTDSRDGEAAALERMQTVLNQTLPVFARGEAPGEVTSDK